MAALLRVVAGLQLVASVHDHPPTNAGIFKSTIAASDPTGTTLPWLLRYLPVYDANHDDDHFKCGSTGRTEVNGTTGFEPEFGIHTVYAAGRDDSRAQASGQLSLAEIEAIWDQEIGDLADESRGYNGWLDNHLALWTPSMAPFVMRFASDNVPHMKRSWKGDDGSLLYSLVVHAPKTQLVLELISNVTGDDAGRWPLQPEPRHLFHGHSAPSTEFGYLSPLHVSRAVRDLDEVRIFYGKVFNSTPTLHRRLKDGTEVMVFGGNANDTFSSRVSLQFVKRAERRSQVHHSAEWFQAYMLNVSKTYMTSYKSCWPIWGDNHIAVAMSLDLAVLKTRLDALDEPMYHAFHGISAGPSVIYLVDPSGWTVQLSGQWPDDPDFLPDAEVDSGGFAGYCFESCMESKSVFVI